MVVVARSIGGAGPSEFGKLTTRRNRHVEVLQQRAASIAGVRAPRGSTGVLVRHNGASDGAL